MAHFENGYSGEGGPSGRWRRAGRSMSAAVRHVVIDHGLWAAIVGVHLGIGWIAGRLGVLTVIQSGFVDPLLLRRFFLIAFFWIPPYVAWRRLCFFESGMGSTSTWSAWKDIVRQLRVEFGRERLLGACMATLLVMMTFRAHDSWKSALATAMPYTWDARLSSWSRAVHFGHYPWQLLQPLVGYPWVTRFLDWAYFAWYQVVTIVLVWQVWSGDRERRRRFFIAFALVIVLLGTIVAFAMPSGGPVFYHNLVPGPDPYAGLVRYLAQVNAHRPLWAFQLQQLVWANYADHHREFWIAMSAMPSLHVAMVTLFACVGWATSRTLGVVLSLYVLVILVGSIHLGWHYALDGYAAILGTVIIWWCCGRLCEPAESCADH